MRRATYTLSAALVISAACGRTSLGPNQLGRADGGADSQLVGGASGGEDGRADSAASEDGRRLSKSTGRLAIARSSHTATLLPNGLVLLAGGNGVADSKSSAMALVAPAELYDSASGVFRVTGSMVVARTQHTATLLPDGRVLIVGGAVGGSGDGAVLAQAELYDPAQGRFTATGTMSARRWRHSATLLGSGQVLITGGFDTMYLQNAAATAELYDPASGRFTTTGTMLTPSADHTATLLPDGKVLILGGRNSSPSYSRAEVYDPAKGIFVDRGRMSYARYGHVATALANGDVLVTGGWGSGDFYKYLASSELYRAATGTIVEVAALRTARAGHSATLLADGKVFVTGGWATDNGAASLSSSELYDPNSRSFAGVGPLAFARKLHTATLLNGGKVLIAGGSDREVLSSAELY